jgi:hypothetical protein
MSSTYGPKLPYAYETDKLTAGTVKAGNPQAGHVDPSGHTDVLSLHQFVDASSQARKLAHTAQRLKVAQDPNRPAPIEVLHRYEGDRVPGGIAEKGIDREVFGRGLEY